MELQKILNEITYKIKLIKDIISPKNFYDKIIIKDSYTKKMLI